MFPKGEESAALPPKAANHTHHLISLLFIIVRLGLLTPLGAHTFMSACMSYDAKMHQQLRAGNFYCLFTACYQWQSLKR